MKVAYVNSGNKGKGKSVSKPEDLQSLSRLVNDLILSNKLKNAAKVLNRYIETAEIINEEAQRNEAVKALREHMERNDRRRAERRHNLPKGSLD